MKKFVRFFSLAFVVTLLMLIIFTKDSQAATSLSQLEATYPTGSTWTDTYYGLKKVEGGYARVIATECAGFAALMYNRYYDMDPYEYATEVKDINSVQAGDIVRYGNNAHSVWVLSRNGDYVQVAECNYDLNCSVRWYQTKSLEELNNGLTYIYKAPYTLNGTTATISSRDSGERKTTTSNEPIVYYRTHIQTLGWQEFCSNGEVAGTEGRHLRLEAIEIVLRNTKISGSIEYSSYVQKTGFQPWKKNGELSGTEGKGLRVEGIKIRLTGELSRYYDVYYKVCCKNIGWTEWKQNGEFAGTKGRGLRVEAIKIKLVKRQTLGVESYESSSVQLLKYQTHVQKVGWQDFVKTGELSGTEGRSLRLEGIKIQLNNSNISGNIEYSTHVQKKGWQPFVKNGKVSGTQGMSLRLEGIKIRLTGDLSKQYDVYYRVHCQDYGWMGWAKNGEAAGTQGKCLRLEGIQIVVVKKGAKAPGSTAHHFIK